MASVALRKEVISNLRKLLRAEARCFGQDHMAHTAARKQIREEVEKNRGLTNEEEIRIAIAGLQEAAHFLTHNIVQGTHDADTNSVRIPVAPEHAKLVDDMTLEDAITPVSDLDLSKGFEQGQAVYGGKPVAGKKCS
eukprot:TRINITY_DN1022_c1_g1_i3.p1 TRINITY_DN1022_c1_g1~~TRINITY_DN1022_c1_g1_i3.p1  ORF type:complete len:137 (-),score=26.35 TRINITY_DN1022_c1_g1_i3:120-530(-)